MHNLFNSRPTTHKIRKLCAHLQRLQTQMDPCQITVYERPSMQPTNKIADLLDLLPVSACTLSTNLVHVTVACSLQKLMGRLNLTS